MHQYCNDSTSTGSVHKSIGDRVVCMCVQLNRCYVVCVSDLQSGQCGKVCVFKSRVPTMPLQA